MRGAMIRNTRAVVALKLPRRHAADDQGRRRAGRARGLRRARRRRAPAGRRAAVGRHRLALQHLLGAAGSSPQPRRRPRSRVRGAPPRRQGLAGAGRTLGGRRDRRQGGGAARSPAAQPGGEEARLRPFARDARPSRRRLLAHGVIAVRALRRQPERAGEGCRHRRVPRARAGAAVHGVRRRGAQHPVLQHADQFRRAVEPHGDRAAHRAHRPHRPVPRGVRLQSRRRAARWRSRCWPCSTRRSRCSSWWSARSARSSAASRRNATSPTSCSTRGWSDRGRPGRGLRRARAAARARRGAQHEGAKALDEALFGEDFETA